MTDKEFKKLLESKREKDQESEKRAEALVKRAQEINSEIQEIL